MNMSPEDMKRLEAIKKSVLSRVLSKEAYGRLSRIKLIKPDKAAQIELYLLQLYQSGKLKGEITDEQMKQILGSATEEKKFSIKRI